MVGTALAAEVRFLLVKRVRSHTTAGLRQPLLMVGTALAAEVRFLLVKRVRSRTTAGLRQLPLGAREVGRKFFRLVQGALRR
jgi:hypothetical protein